MQRLEGIRQACIGGACMIALMEPIIQLLISIGQV